MLISHKNAPQMAIIHDHPVGRGVQELLRRSRQNPSSKTCSACGHKLEALPLAVREWTCPACATVHDRDVNAAINLRNLAVSSTVSACGEEGAGLGRKHKTKPASVKQESGTPSAAKLPMGSFA